MSEDEIKIIENYITDTPVAPYECLMNLERNAIEHLLKEYKKQAKEIEELKVINNMQKYRIEVIDERELIPKQKIKDKIEEYKHKDFIKTQVVMRRDKEALKIVEVLQEFLEEE